MSLEIIDRDRHFVVVNKPAGVGVGTDDSRDETLLERVRAWYQAEVSPSGKGYCVPIHFLDRPVSGAIVFALSSKAAARLNDQFKKRRVSKQYLAIVRGRPAQDEAELRHHLVKDRGRNVTRTTSADDPDGKECVLSYKVVASDGSYSALLVKPVTGRSHQIRVQLATLGTPICGDLKYGDTKPWHERIALHALHLSIEHPTEKTPMNFTAPLPSAFHADFANLIKDV